jgi:multiple sugar transport system permease protein
MKVSQGGAQAKRQGLAGWAFVSPALLLLSLFFIVPLGAAIWYSFTDKATNVPFEPRFIGIQNYRNLFSNGGTFIHSIMRTFAFALPVVIVQTAVAMGLALLVNQKVRGRNIFRSIYFVPTTTVMTVATFAWVALLDKENGVLGKFVHFATFGAVDSVDWLGNRAIVLPISILIIGVWQGAGFQMLILLAGLQDIPAEQYEASRIDGANNFRQFRYITVPGLRNRLIFVGTVTFILAMRIFDPIWAIPTLRGGPNDGTRTMLVDVVTQGSQGNVGVASAMSVVFFVVVLAVAGLNRVLFKEERS